MTFNLEPTMIDADEERKFLQDEMADRILAQSVKSMKAYRALSEPKFLVPYGYKPNPRCIVCGGTGQTVYGGCGLCRVSRW